MFQRHRNRPLVGLVGRVPDCTAGGHRFEFQSDQHSASDGAAIAMASANGLTFTWLG